MAKADSVYITPPTNASALDHPPRDPTRRRFLAVAAVASAVGAGSLAAAAAMAPDVPRPSPPLCPAGQIRRLR